MVRRRKADRISWASIVLLVLFTDLAITTAEWLLDPNLPFVSRWGPSRFPFLIVGPFTVVIWIMFISGVKSRSELRRARQEYMNAKGATAGDRGGRRRLVIASIVFVPLVIGFLLVFLLVPLGALPYWTQDVAIFGLLLVGPLAMVCWTIVFFELSDTFRRREKREE